MISSIANMPRRGPKFPMSLRRLRFTIRQLMLLIVALAIFLAVLRMTGSAVVAATGFVLIGFFIERHRQGPGIYGGTMGGGILFLGVGIYLCLQSYLFPVPNAVDYVGPFITLAGLFAEGLTWGLMVSSAFYFILKSTKRYFDRRPLADDSCGSIVWRRFEGT
jgi:hypothetical protein